ncbi:MAG TPA: hypothetical protein VF666_09975 [Pyrinomonadaceae bacterium]
MRAQTPHTAAPPTSTNLSATTHTTHAASSPNTASTNDAATTAADRSIQASTLPPVATNAAPSLVSKSDSTSNTAAMTNSVPPATVDVAAPTNSVSATLAEHTSVTADTTVATADEAATIAASTEATPTDPLQRRPPIRTSAEDVCKRTIFASVVALAQPYMLNRLGASMPNALIFALESDVDNVDNDQIRLKPNKRPRPLVLRANVGDCLQITLKNRVYQYPVAQPPPPGYATCPTLPCPILATTEVSLHVQGMHLKDTINSDGSFVGVNNSSLAQSPLCGTASNLAPCKQKPGSRPQTPAKPGQNKTYSLYAQREGSFLLSSLGDANTTGQNIDYLVIGQLASGLFGAVNVQPEGAEWYRSQVTRQDLQLAIDRTKGNGGMTALGQPIINYDAKYPARHPLAGKPILKMLDERNQIVYSDLTAVITGPNHGRFPGTTGIGNPEPPCSLLDDPRNRVKIDPLFCDNPALPDRKQPYREISILYHEVSNAMQAFSVFRTPSDLAETVGAGQDAFAINFGTGGIGAEIYANRIKVGPMANCVDCKFEEFFLSSWTVGDPATVVDFPANYAPTTPPTQPCTPQSLTNGTCETEVMQDPPPGAKATKVFYPDDPSNVYHSYLNDHVKFRILHGGNGVTHVHHQHAQQWLQTPNSDKSAYLDSQMISPGASYSLEMVNNGSGNINKTVGDSIFHCHFYPHFAAGMWSLWRVHDVFEAGTALDAEGRLVRDWNRVLPDGEIRAGVPIPALVPMPTIPMAPVPARVKICGVDSSYNLSMIVGADCPAISPTAPVIGSIAVVNKDDVNNGLNPGYPFFIPGIAGARAPHPPFDFAPVLDASGNPVPGKHMDGGLPRHIVTGGNVSNEQHTKYDWSKDFDLINAIQLPESGTPVEEVAMKYHGTRNHTSYTPEGQPQNFQTNGLPRKPSNNYPAQNQYGSQLGAPYADPGINLKGEVVGGVTPTRYKTAAFQLDVTLNNQGWHSPQQRMMALWEDVVPTSNFVYPPADSNARKRAPEPLFFRVNSGDVVELWHTNLVPNYYTVDDFQVRTPTDIIGQHIHLVQFDVMTADGAANGFNYEDGTFSPGEVQELIHGIRKANNCTGHDSGDPRDGTFACPVAQPPPAGIINCAQNPSDARCKRWAGAQTTVQRWFAAPLLDNHGHDRTIGTVFTHDHFGPSTHQQVGLYGGLLIEPPNSIWKDSETGKIFGGDNIPPPRADGGPTSWKADIIYSQKPDAGGKNIADSYREFALEFQDFQLAYSRYTQNAQPFPNPDPSIGYRNTGTAPITNAVNPPSTPSILSSGAPPGTMSLNYRNEPIPYRVGQFGDFSSAFDSTFKQASNLPPNQDPTTPLMRAYQNDNVQVRILVGAHQLAHFFTINGMKWTAEPWWSNSGFRSTQAMGISEHFELRFTVPPSSIQTVFPCPDDKDSPCNFSDYLYEASAGDNGLTNGLWGIFRAYAPNKVAKNLQPLPNNPVVADNKVAYGTCPPNLVPPEKIRNFDIVATTTQQILPNGTLNFNSRGKGTGDASTQLVNPFGVVYVRAEDLDASGKLKTTVPNIEPLILRAAAGDCINVTLTNGISQTASVLSQQYTLQEPFNVPLAGNITLQFNPSQKVGLRPQLLAYDVATSGGINAGYNTSKNQVASIGGAPVQYQWYAGEVERKTDGTLKHTPIEFGALNLLPSDPLLQHINGLYGAMVIEPAGATWMCDGKDKLGNPKLVDCDQPPANGDSIVSRAFATVTPLGGVQPFREFVMLMNEDLKMQPGSAGAQTTMAAINYRSEPTFYRFGNTSPNQFSPDGDNDCSMSNTLVIPASSPAPPVLSGDPVTPVFTARAGTPVRFRMLHPPGSGIAQVFTLNGHVWQRNPYIADSTQIGDNRLSQWMGSLDNHGSTTHYNLVIDQAGGPYKVPGDYLYTAFVPAKSQYGLWGIFRVLDANGKVVSGNPACKPKPVLTPLKPVIDLLDRFRIGPGTEDTKP